MEVWARMSVWAREVASVFLAAGLVLLCGVEMTNGQSPATVQRIGGTGWRGAAAGGWNPALATPASEMPTRLAAATDDFYASAEFLEMPQGFGEPHASSVGGPVVAGPTVAGPAALGPAVVGSGDVWQWQLLPAGIIYHSYFAGVHESRLAGHIYGDGDSTSYLDATLGGRVGIIRYGSWNELHPEGWQLDLEGAAFPRLFLGSRWDVDATDFRIGIPLTYGIDNWQYKLAWYHLSSHLGDELIIRDPSVLAERINYSRDAIVLGASWFPMPSTRVYAELDYGVHLDDGAEPWEFQFGIDYAAPGVTDFCGVPFLAVNGHIREANDFGGNFVAQAGRLWRGPTGHTLRFGVHYYNGKSSQFEFFDEFEQQIGLGLWYDQ